MARVTLGTGESITIGGVTEVFGTSGSQSVTVIDGSEVIFRSGFNSGGDTIRLTGNADDFSAVLVGSNVVLTSAVDGISITIPVGPIANTLVFDNGDSRDLSLDTGTGTVSLGDQTIGGTPVDLTPGPGVYFVVADGDVTEGGVITFTVTRTDATDAETLQFTVQGDDNNGTVPEATPGADFTVAGNSIVFAAGQTTATFTVSANTDNLVEGLEGLGVKIFSGSEVVAETNALILDANTVGQTFELTPGIDTIGTGAATDLIGSEGSTNTDGQDTIIGTTGFPAGDFNVFDNIDGGEDRDTLIVLDQGSPFTFAPNFSNVTIQNVEELFYTAPTRGFSGNALNTTMWTGLEEATININAGVGGAQTLTLATGTSLTLNQAGSADLNINGGGGPLAVSATTGDVTIGQTTAANAWSSVTVLGGDDVSFTDRGAANPVDVLLDGFTGDATLTGGQITSATIQNLSGGSRTVNVNTPNAVVNLQGINVADLDVSGGPNVEDSLVVNVNGSVFGLDNVQAPGDVTLNNNWTGTLFLGDIESTSIIFPINNVVTLNANNGSIVGDDINGNNPPTFANDVIVINLNATGGDITLDDLFGTEFNPGQLSVNITGSGDVFFDTVSGTTITRTGSGDTTIGDLVGSGPYRSALSTTTQFNGSAGTGDDTMTFAAGNQQTNTFGGGDDFVALLGALGTNGSLDGGDEYDTLAMESNAVAAWTAAGPTATSNFEQLELTPQVIAKHDVIDLGNIGFDGQSDVDSYVGAGSETEVATINFAGIASSTDSVTFEGITVQFADEDGPAALAAAFIAGYNGAGTGTYVASAGPNPGDVVLTSIASGERADITPADFTFTDATTIGTPGLEGAGLIFNTRDGVAADPGSQELVTFIAGIGADTDLQVPAGSTLTIGYTTSAGNGEFTFTAAVDLTTVGGELATFVAQAANADPDFSALFTATVDGNNVSFAATGNFDADIATFTVGGGWPVGATLITTQQGADPFAGVTEEAFFAFDGVATGNDQLLFDGVTITFDDGDLPGALAADFFAQYNSAIGRTYNATTPNFLEPFFLLPGGVELDAINVGDLPNLTPADFVFIDDDNVGTPTVSVTNIDQGSTASVTLNNFISGSTLTVNAPLATHTVNMTTDTASDELNIVLANNGDHGSVTANDAETVNINTDSVGGSQDALVLNDTDLTTLTVSGADGLTLDTNSTIISSIDASGLGGTFIWSADANTVAITVETGPGGSVVDFSAMTLPGGNTFTGNAPVLFIGGNGNDNITTGDQGTSRGTITTGGGADTVHVGVVDGGNDYWSITDFTAGIFGDTLDFDGPVSFAGLDQELEPTATFQDYLDQAADGDVVGAVHYFYWEGDTYVVQDNTVGEDFVDGSDTVIRLEGIIDLQAVNIT